LSCIKGLVGMPLLKFKRQDLFSFLSSNGVNEKIIELLRRLRTGDFDGLFTDQYNARHFRDAVYDQCTDMKNKFYCAVIVYPDYASFIVWAPNERVYEVVVGVNDDGLLFSNIVRILDSENFDKKKDLPSKKWKWGKYDLFGTDDEVTIYSVGSPVRIRKLFGYDEELTQSVSVIDVSNHKVVRVQGDRTLVVEPLDVNSFLSAIRRNVETYMRYLWIDTLLFTFVNNHITAHPDEFMNIVIRRFFFSSAPWVDTSKIDPEPIWDKALDFLARWLRTTANIYATQAQLEGFGNTQPSSRNCGFTRFGLVLSTEELGAARVRVGSCEGGEYDMALLLRVEDVNTEGSTIAKMLVQDIMQNLKERRFNLTRYFGNHKAYMENVVPLPFEYNPPSALSFRMLDPATIRVGEDWRGWYYVDEKSLVRFEHPEHPPREVRFNKPAFISIGSTNVANAHMDLMNAITLADLASKLGFSKPSTEK